MKFLTGKMGLHIIQIKFLAKMFSLRSKEHACSSNQLQFASENRDFGEESVNVVDCEEQGFSVELVFLCDLH